jgi:hypothetical protein
MVVHAGACLRELVRLDEDSPPAPSRVALRRSDAADVIRQKRAAGCQDVAFGARPFILCGLPIRRLPEGVLTYSRRNGRFLLEITGNPRYGVPFGQDRLIPLWIATQAVRNQSRTVEFGSARQILMEWGLPENGSHYHRLADGFRRIFASTIFFGTSLDSLRSEAWDCSRLHFFERMRLWFRPEQQARSEPVNLVTLTEAFWEEIRAHPVPVDADVVRALASNPGCLDLYTWLTWRCHLTRTEELVPLFGPLGFANQLGVQNYERERKFRERLRRWLELVRVYWPECPARILQGGHHLKVSPATSLCPKAKNWK